MDCAKWTYSSVWSHGTIPRVDTRAAAARCSNMAFSSRVFASKRAAVELGPRASSVGADGRIRPITDACRETDRSERSKVSLMLFYVSCLAEQAKILRRRSEVAARLGQRPPLHKGGKGETGESATRGVAGGGAEASGWALRRSDF